MEKARDALKKEVDIVKIIRYRRFVYKALEHLLDADVIKVLKEKSRIKEINTEEDCQESDSQEIES